MKAYIVTFEWYDTGTWCTNIVKADSEDVIHAHYKKFGEKRYVHEAKEYELDEAKRKGMPIVTI